MEERQVINLLKALSDASRLRILASLREGPSYGEALAERLGLSQSTVSFHLKRLAAVGMVRKVKEQYYTMYHLVPERLEVTLADLVGVAEGTTKEQTARLARYRQKVVDTFFEGGRLTHLPAQMKKRRIVLEAMVAEVDLHRVYMEWEIDDLLERRFDDYCTIRRELVDTGLVARRDGKYWRVGALEGIPRAVIPEERGASSPHSPRQSAGQGESFRAMGAPEDTIRPTSKQSQPGVARAPEGGDKKLENQTMTTTKQTRRRELKQAYKEQEKVAGVYWIRNKQTGRALLGSSLVLPAPLKRHTFELSYGSHRNEDLQRDWDELGPEAFDVEILETVEQRDEEGFDLIVAMEALEARWMVKLGLPGEGVYNEDDRIRTPPF